MSEIRPTGWGPMRFEFRLGADGHFDVTGTPTDPAAEVYRRGGPYRLEGGQLLSPAINEGQPVHVRRDGDVLVLVIDETLGFRLRRR